MTPVILGSFKTAFDRSPKPFALIFFVETKAKVSINTSTAKKIGFYC